MKTASGAFLGACSSLLLLSDALPGCYLESQCNYKLTDKAGKQLAFDLRGLCNRDVDYTVTDPNGQKYSAQICGIASKRCNPYYYNNEYEYGTVIQSWGDEPPCDLSCIEKGSDPPRPVCCTEPCMVVAVGAPTVGWINGDQTKGVQLDYVGGTPRANDPYPCATIPGSSPTQYYPRTTHMQFFCDPLADGYATVTGAYQDAIDNCDYTLTFKTSAACIGQPLSGGWVFIILLILTSVMYYGIALYLGYRANGVVSLPHAHAAFWSTWAELIADGIAATFGACGRALKGGKGYTAVKAPEPVPFSSTGSAVSSTDL